VTCVVADELLIDVEPGHDRAAARDRVRSRHHDRRRDPAGREHRDAGRGEVDAQPSAAVRRRRHLAHLLHHARPGRARALQRGLACETLQQLADEVCEEGGVDPAEVYEVALAGNATMTQPALGIDPEPVGWPVIMAARTYPTCRRRSWASPLHPRACATVFPALGAYVGGDIVAGLLATG
jgi:hypothetical protein